MSEPKSVLESETQTESCDDVETLQRPEQAMLAGSGVGGRSDPEELFGIPIDSRHRAFVQRLRDTMWREAGVTGNPRANRRAAGACNR